jgi:hypothetical protein
MVERQCKSVTADTSFVAYMISASVAGTFSTLHTLPPMMLTRDGHKLLEELPRYLRNTEPMSHATNFARKTMGESGYVRILCLRRKSVAALKHFHCGRGVTSVAAAAVGVAIQEVPAKCNITGKYAWQAEFATKRNAVRNLRGN